ncbi:Uncharacterised protein [Escherichia coli]|nr:Uncharacterised protein [Escherichia coli]
MSDTTILQNSTHVIKPKKIGSTFWRSGGQYGALHRG